jgi:hypothetical protein
MPPVDPGSVEIVLELAGDPPAGQRQAVLDRAAVAAGAPVRVLHAGSTDPDLARMAVVDVPPHLADGVLTRLLDSPDVAAAYVKPTGTPP